MPTPKPTASPTDPPTASPIDEPTMPPANIPPVVPRGSNCPTVRTVSSTPHPVSARCTNSTMVCSDMHRP
jgi:hypothetical protein